MGPTQPSTWSLNFEAVVRDTTAYRACTHKSRLFWQSLAATNAHSAGSSGDLLPPSPPAEKATARQDQAGQASTGDGAGNGREGVGERAREAPIGRERVRARLYAKVGNQEAGRQRASSRERRQSEGVRNRSPRRQVDRYHRTRRGDYLGDKSVDEAHLCSNTQRRHAGRAGPACRSR